MIATSTTPSIRRAGTNSKNAAFAARELYEELSQPNIGFALFHCSPDYDLKLLARELKRNFRDIPLIGCTTAGEISTLGYIEGSLTGVSIASPDFTVATTHIDNLKDFEFSQGATHTQALIQSLEARGLSPTGENTFGYLIMDGLSLKEETVVSAIYRNMRDIPLFGGSAGDGQSFGATYVYHDGGFHRDCALFTLIQTRLPFVVFRTQHFVPTGEKMVVTEAEPTRRLVTEINGLPAGREYARMVGLEVDELTPQIFARYPVLVKIGGNNFVRSIAKVNGDESLTFFCAIDAGVVLTVARGVDLVSNLREAFANVRNRIGPPALVLGCDCILRHIELQQRGTLDQVTQVFAENNVVGFASYGEQFNAMHTNQTFTGVAIGSGLTP